MSEQTEPYDREDPALAGERALRELPAGMTRPSDWTVAELGTRARPRRAVCPACKRWQRVGYRAGGPVIGQHDQPAEQVPGNPGAPTWVGSPHCPGSLASVRESETVEHREARALGRHIDVATAQMPAVPAPRRAQRHRATPPSGQQPPATTDRSPR